MASETNKSYTYQLKGSKELEAKIKAIAASAPKNVAAALYREAQVVMTASKKRVPTDTSALKNSGIVMKPVYEGNVISVRLGYGGPASGSNGPVDVGYAAAVHEIVGLNHPSGQDHFLSSVLDESAPHLLQRIANRLDLMAAKAAETE